MEATPPPLALAAASGLALVHLLSGRLRFIHYMPRNRWLSFAGGVSVAYVFLHLIPELARGQETVAHATGGLTGFAEKHVYLIALAGLATFYGLERMAAESRRQQRDGGEDRTGTGVFWIHIGSFALYNGLVGYLLLHLEDPGATPLLLFFVAMALHFVVNDFGLREHHKEQYTRTGRWVVAAAVLAGWGVGYAAEIPEAAIATLVAFLAGGVILNVLKEEVPAERSSRFGALALGMAVYSALLLAL